MIDRASLDRRAWNEALAALGGHLLQSWEWGSFKADFGWRVERITIGSDPPRAMASVLFRHRGPVSIGYIPRGPAVATGDLEAARILVDEIDRRARANHALSLRIEADRPIDGITDRTFTGMSAGSHQIQPSRTVKVPLGDDESLLAGMHQKTRYSVRLAPRKGVLVETHTSPITAALDAFYGMLRETAVRNEFGIHSRAYYESFLRHFEDRAALLIARLDDHPAAGLICARFGSEAIYMYGASDTQYRAVGAAFNLQFRAMQWGREAGATSYDLWGIPDDDPPKDNDHQDRVPATRGDDWRGLYRFKTGFGGSIVQYPPTTMRVYHPRLARLAARLTSRDL